MELLTFTIAANETKEFRKAGRYMEIIDSAFAVTLLLFGDDGNQTDDATNALSGIYIEEAYSAFQVKNGASAQTVTLLIHDGRGGSRRQPGNVRVIDEITDALQGFNIPSTTAIQPVTYVQILAPAANARGVILRQAGVTAQNGAGGATTVTLVAAKTTPTGYSVPLQRYDIVGSFANGGVSVSSSKDLNKLLPPGWGLFYSVENTAVGLIANGSVKFEVL